MAAIYVSEAVVTMHSWRKHCFSVFSFSVCVRAWNRHLLHPVFCHHHAQHESPQPQREGQTQSAEIRLYEQRHQQRGGSAHWAAHGQWPDVVLFVPFGFLLFWVSSQTSDFSHVGSQDAKRLQNIYLEHLHQPTKVWDIYVTITPDLHHQYPGIFFQEHNDVTDTWPFEILRSNQFIKNSLKLILRYQI